MVEVKPRVNHEIKRFEKEDRGGKRFWDVGADPGFLRMNHLCRNKPKERRSAEF